MVCCKTRLCQQNTRSAWGTYFWHLGCLGYRFGMKVLGPTLFIAANGLIVSIAVIFFFVFYPELYQTSPTACIVNALLGAYLLLNLLSNYFLCALTAPGSPSYCPDPSRLGEKVAIVDGRRIFQFSYHLQVAPFVSYRYCHLCKCIKPPRAHHCSVLGRCVLNMDHYCPWMATTVGYGNYRHFVLFLVYMFASCWYVTLFFMLGTVELSPLDREFIYLNFLFRTSVFVADTLSASMYCFSLALSGIVSTGLLLGWHAYLTVTNQVCSLFVCAVLGVVGMPACCACVVLCCWDL